MTLTLFTLMVHPTASLIGNIILGTGVLLILYMVIKGQVRGKHWFKKGRFEEQQYSKRPKPPKTDK